MKLLPSLFVLLTISVFGSSGVNWDNLQIKYAVTGGYWEMPLTVNEINTKQPQSFQFVRKDRELNVDLYSHFEDPRFFLLFDTYGNIAGIRTGYIKADIDKKAKENNLTFPYNYEEISMFKEGNFWKKDIWYINILFVSPEKLKSGGRKETKGQVAEGLYVILDGKWLEVAKDECQVEKQGFTKQACYAGMGQHYFFKLTPSLDCKKFQPIFPLFDAGQLIGFGLTPFGSFTSKEKGQEWFELLGRKAAEVIVPTAPKCALDWFDKFGSTSLHVFFIKDARKLTCPKENTLKC